MGEEITPMVTGAGRKRCRSISRLASSSPGLFRAAISASFSPTCRRASPAITTSRHGVILPWSGTRVPMVRI
ncbi:hypothetical protein D3C72_2222440 [compost metagenome]